MKRKLMEIKDRFRIHERFPLIKMIQSTSKVCPCDKISIDQISWKIGSNTASSNPPNCSTFIKTVVTLAKYSFGSAHAMKHSVIIIII